MNLDAFLAERGSLQQAGMIVPPRKNSPDRASEKVGGFSVPAAPYNAEEPTSGSGDENNARLSEDTAATASDRNWAATKRGCKSVTAGETASDQSLRWPVVTGSVPESRVAGDVKGERPAPGGAPPRNCELPSASEHDLPGVAREGAAPERPAGAAPVALGVSSLDLAPSPPVPAAPAAEPLSGEPSAADVRAARAYRSVRMSAREIAAASGWTVPYAKRAIELARRA